MKYLPILQEMFESDSVIFFLTGLLVSVVISMLMMKEAKKKQVCTFVSMAVYAVCELIANVVHSGFLVDILLVFAGTAAIGACIGFGVTFLISKYKNKAV